MSIAAICKDYHDTIDGAGYYESLPKHERSMREIAFKSAVERATDTKGAEKWLRAEGASRLSKSVVVACSIMDVSPDDIRGIGQTKRLCDCRAVLAYVLYDMKALGYKPSLGEMALVCFGGRNHTSVLSSIDRARRVLLSGDEQMRRDALAVAGAIERNLKLATT